MENLHIILGRPADLNHLWKKMKRILNSTGNNATPFRLLVVVEGLSMTWAATYSCNFFFSFGLKILIYSFAYLFTQLNIYLLIFDIYLLILYLFIYSFYIYLFTHFIFIYLLILYLFINCIYYLYIYLFIWIFIYLFVYLFTHLHIYSFIWIFIY